MIIPTLFILLQNISFVTKSTATLPCNGTNVTWIYYPHIPIYEDVIYTNHSKVNSYVYDNRYIVHNSSTLFIRNVHVVDKGHYVCIDDHDNVVKFYNLSIIDNNKTTDVDVFNHKRLYNKIHIPDRITIHPHIEVVEGSTVNLKCFSSGHKLDYVFVRHYSNIVPRNNEKKQILYTEYFNNFYYSDDTKVVLNQTESMYEIIISNINDCDSGLYECSLLNSDSSSDIYTITVIPKEKAWIRKSTADVDRARRSRERFLTYFQRHLGINI
jgi:Immunoglobulin V-set domain